MVTVIVSRRWAAESSVSVTEDTLGSSALQTSIIVTLTHVKTVVHAKSSRRASIVSVMLPGQAILVALVSSHFCCQKCDTV